jgi:uncharacterized heparinase superfamily protein
MKCGHWISFSAERQFLSRVGAFRFPEFSVKCRKTPIEWYARRLARMSVPEVVHRVAAYSKYILDGLRGWGWGAFGGFGGLLVPPPCLRFELEADVYATVKAQASAALSGEFHFLGVDWPEAKEGWERTLWHLDPITATSWSGKGVFAFRIQYRHEGEKGDVKFVWEPNRLQFLQSIAAVAAREGNAEKWSRIIVILKGWMEANPPFHGVNWTSGIEAASRIVSAIVVLAYADTAHRAELDRLLRPFIEAHAFWLARYPSLYSSANNHRVAELGGLFLASLCAPDMPGAARYREEAREGLELEVTRQFFADGVNAEQSPTYAAYSLEWFILAGMVASLSGVPFSATYRDRLIAAERFLRSIADDGGRMPHIGDDDEGYVLKANFTAPERYPITVAKITARWAGDNEPAPQGLRTFETGGYTVIREPTLGGTLLAVFDHGPLGFLSIAAHGHADALAFWLHWGEETIFADAGTYLYHSGGEWRNRFRGTPVHNTLTIEDENQSVVAGGFNWSQHAQTKIVSRSSDEVTAICDGYQKRFGLIHERKLRYERGSGFVIEDRLLGEPKRIGLRWSAGFTLHPTVTCHVDGKSAHLRTEGGRCLLVTLGGDAAGWALKKLPYSSRFNCLEETNRIENGGLVRGGEYVMRTSIRLSDGA